jgi:hypothetical protein
MSRRITTKASGSATTTLTSYTDQLSNDQYRIRDRTQKLNMPKYAVVDALQGFASIFTSMFITLYLGVGLVALLPFFFASTLWAYFVTGNKLHFVASRLFALGRDKPSNVSNSSGSWTAIAVLAYRAIFSNGLGGPDNLSLEMLYNTSPLGSDTPVVGLQAFSNGFWRLVRWNFALTKRMYGDQMSFIFAPQIRVDVFTYLQARTCWMDDVVEEFVRRRADGDTTSNNPTANVVILGAGYDSRCYRSNLNLGERGVKTYEVDAPGTHRNKLRLLEKCNIFSNDTTHVACDFVTQDWMDRLVDIGQLVFRSQLCLYGRVFASFCHKKWWSPPFKK